MPKMLVNSLNFYYETHGEGEALVFIHGLGSSTQDWERQLDYFSSRYQVILFDVRGHGQTDKPPGPYSVPLFAQDLAGLLDTLGIPAAHICGISMGGMIAFQMAVYYPEMVKTLTVVNSGADLVPKSFSDRWNIFQRLVIFRLLSMEKIGETLAKRIFIKPEQEELRTVFETKQIKVHFDLAKLPVMIQADAPKLSRAFYNAFNNAVTFTPDGGKVVVNVSHDAAHAHVSIKDSGPGIPIEQLETIFDRFYQVEGHMTRSFGGMGLGLPIARAMVEMHGGKMWAESAGPGTGTTVLFTLPLAG